MRPLPAELDHPAALHGLSAFTTVRTRSGQPLLLGAHLERLASTCTVLGLPAPDLQLPALDPHPWGLLRLTVLPDGTHWSWRPLAAQAVPAGGVEVWWSGQQVHPVFGRHKTGNYLPYLLAGREARAQGTFEGLLTDSGGQVVDGARSGLLCRLEGRWVVPDGGLPSVTRAAWLAELGERAEELPLTLERLRRASHLYLCGSGVGVVPVGRLRAEGWTQDYAVHWPNTVHPAFVMPGRVFAGSGL